MLTPLAAGCFFLQAPHDMGHPVKLSFCKSITPSPNSVTNSSYNKYTKSSLKIYQIYICNKNVQFCAIFSMSFYCFTWMIDICVEQCHHRDAASSISTFLTLAATDLLTTRKLILLIQHS